MANHEILSGKVQLYRRTNKTWHCSAGIDGVQHRSSTKEEDLALARIAAEDWYLNLRGLSRVGLIKKKEITFTKVADQFELEYERGREVPAGSSATSIGYGCTCDRSSVPWASRR